MLKNNDGKVKAATEQLSSVTGFLAEDKQNLGAALSQLSTALGQVKTFIQDNRERLKTSIAQLVPITQTLVDQRASLAELLDTAPLAADNLLNAYDAQTGTLDGRADINELSMGGDINPTGAGLVPVDPSASTNLPLPLPAVGTVYGSAPGTADTSEGAAAP
jgi:ABC-type transporter Mla subunit MlaD